VLNFYAFNAAIEAAMQLTRQTFNQQTDRIYDVLFVGAEAAGLSAEIYLQRYLLSTLLIDNRMVLP
jgi:alkyl hydroperoxide reductase subunit AhpF